MADPTQTVLLIRHGQTEWSKSGRHTGRTDLDLTDDGRRDATALAARLAGSSFEAVLVSPAKRARATADLAGIGAGAIVDPDLWEYDYGAYEGLTTSQIRANRPNWSLWRDGCPGGETVDDVAVRVDRVITRVRALAVEGDGSANRVRLVAHGHLLRILAARWLQLPGTEGRLFVLDPASLSELGWERESPAILRWNDT